MSEKPCTGNILRCVQKLTELALVTNLLGQLDLKTPRKHTSGWISGVSGGSTETERYTLNVEDTTLWVDVPG